MLHADFVLQALTKQTMANWRINGNWSAIHDHVSASYHGKNFTENTQGLPITTSRGGSCAGKSKPTASYFATTVFETAVLLLVDPCTLLSSGYRVCSEKCTITRHWVV